jgi:hypothetical protein
MARRGTGTAFDQLCNERRISDKLAAENKRLREALEKIRAVMSRDDSDYVDDVDEAFGIAEQALTDQQPTHAPDCAIAVNARHGCTCDAAPEYIGDGRWGLFHAQNCERYDGDHAEVVTWMPELGVE